MAKVFITRKLPGKALVQLTNAGHEVVVEDADRPIERSVLLSKVNGVEAIISLLTEKIDEEVLVAAGPSLKIVANYAVGYDNVDVEACQKHNVYVTNTPSEVVNESVAEFTWAMMMMLGRRVLEAVMFAKKAAYRDWDPDAFLGFNLSGRMIGVVGLGRIGKMVARRAVGFGVKVLYTQRKQDLACEAELGVVCVPLEELLNKSDFVSLHVPLNEETKHLINAESLGRMKQGSFLINAARGPIVDEAALVEALRSGRLGGAALDVFENEPNPHPELLQMENVILTPHVASGTVEAREDMELVAVRNVLAALSGETPPNVVGQS